MDNWVYGLTKKQTSPTSPLGFKSKTDQWGAVDYPINPLKQAIAAGATFVARTTSTNPNHVLAMMEAAMDQRRFQFHRVPERMRGILRRRVRCREPAQRRHVHGSSEEPRHHRRSERLPACRRGFPGYFGIFYNVNKPPKTRRKPTSTRPRWKRSKASKTGKFFKRTSTGCGNLRYLIAIYESVEFSQARKLFTGASIVNRES